MTIDPSAPIVRYIPFKKEYADSFKCEAEAIREGLRPSRLFVDHVGSTAVPGLAGKPVIDLFVSLQEWNDIENVILRLETLGYEQGEVLLDPPRCFLGRQTSGDVSFNIHLTPLDSEWGRNMLVFRDELAADQKLAERYADLKKNLATQHKDDLDAYTKGKASFVHKVLREAAGAFGVDRLLTHQRAELDRSQAYQGWAILMQLGMAAVTAVSVYSNDNATMLNFAIVGFLLMAFWLALVSKQRIHRSAGDQARRVALLTSGLGARFSAEQRLRIFDALTVPLRGRPLTREEEHFASRLPHGYRRLAEMIEESAYWSLQLQRASKSVVQAVLAAIVLLLAGSFWLGILTLPVDASVSVARVLVVILVFLMSSDVLGTALAYGKAITTIDDILQRAETAAARDYPERDILLLMADYNAAIENAPFALPFVYRLRAKELNRRWRNYLENRRR